jgi:ATP-dependent RNA helicase DeaD
VFCRTKIEVDELQTVLAACNYNVKALHGDMDQSMRQEIIRRFRGGETRFLVATDVAARGLGVVGVTHVFNYHMPFHREAYIHRIGRTGRAGQKGKAMTLVTPSEYVKLKRIQDAVKANFLPREVPRINAVQGRLDQGLIEAISTQEATNESVELLARLESTMDISQIACRLIALLQAGRKARGPQMIGLDEKRLERLVSRQAPSRRPGQSGGKWQRGRNDTRRPDSRRPDTRRPESRSAEGQRPNGRRPDGRRSGKPGKNRRD